MNPALLPCLMLLALTLGGEDTQVQSPWSCPQQADTNGDGQDEQIQQGQSFGQAWTLQVGEKQIPLPVPASLIHKACLADLDGDGKAEILISHTAATEKDPTFQKRLFIYRQKGLLLRPTFLGSRGGGPLVDFGVSDLDKDGKNEVMTWEFAKDRTRGRIWTWDGYSLTEHAKLKDQVLPAPPRSATRIVDAPAPAEVMPSQTILAALRVEHERSPGRMRQARVWRNLKPAANARQFRFLPKAARRHLARHGFVVLKPAQAPAEFHSVYINNQYERLPTFVTADAALHLTHLVFDQVLKDLELGLLAPGLTHWTLQAAEQAEGLCPSLPPPLKSGMDKLSHRLRIAACLLGAEPACRFPRVREASNNLEGQLCPKDTHCLDVASYKPRGHYERSEALRRYFRARLWLSERLSTWDEAAAAALLLSHWPAGRQHLIRVDALERALVGPPANDSILDLLRLARSKLGPRPGWADWAKPGHWPKANQTKVTSVSLLARRWPADNKVLVASSDENLRPKPSPLDLLQALGSEEARRLLAPAMQDWPELQKRLEKQRAAFAQGELLDTQSVGGRWLAAMRWLLLPFPKGYARFQQSQAWAGHAMTSMAAAWAELRRDTILYVQPPILYMEGGDEDQLPPHRAGFVEPLPDLYRELAQVMAGMRQAYTAMGAEALNRPRRRTREAGPLTKLKQMQELLEFLADCADKQLQGVPLDKEAHERLHGIGGEFEHIAAGSGSLKPDPLPIIADVFIVVKPEDDSRERLMLATGTLDWIVVVVPLGKRTILARGAISSFYSFWSDKILTDTDWRERLEQNKAPAPPDWQKRFPLPKRKRRKK
ncbi:MAG: DUF3160 domain-containing protein [Deltaproteobacteria bacterium]|nr:DUF3160 domain-containing protein [Deltaproteobacteria bacterium]